MDRKTVVEDYNNNENKYDLAIFILGLVNNMGFQVIVAFSS